ncbi:MAG: ABC transporter permease [Bifidobacteriaceae bacterium]|jgi:peptide/nickel transport system permease protein|nr:ABC transporter permease [Bifidobacteriaceae bacterium]
MSGPSDLTAPARGARSRRGRLAGRARRAGRLGVPARVWVCVAVIAAAIVVSLVLPPFLADFAEQDILDSLKPPVPWDGSDPAHPLGTDTLGRDILARLAVGLRVSLAVAAFGTLIALVVGIVLGVLAGYRGGWTDNILMRVADVQLSVPALVLVMFAVTLIGRDTPTIIVVLGLVTWVAFARVARAQVLSLREQDLVVASRSLGLPEWRILTRHVLPSIMGPLSVLASVEVGALVVAEAALGYLGLGVPPPHPSLGAMISEGQQVLTAGIWWPVVMPGAVIAALVLAANVLGDWLRDRFDPLSERSFR